jgi:alanyl-tRNA synthetase
MEVNNVGASSGVDYSASNVNRSSAANNESQVNNSSNVNSASATEDSKKTDDSQKPEEPKDKDKTEKNKEKEELQKQIEELKKQLEELKKKLEEQKNQKPQGNCSKPQQAQQSPQAQQLNQNQNDPNQLILQDIIQVLEAEKNGGMGLQQSVNKLKQDYMMVKSMNVPLKPEIDQMAQQILQKYGNQGIGANPLLSNQLATGLNPTQAVNPLNNIQQPQTQGINF